MNNKARDYKLIHIGGRLTPILAMLLQQLTKQRIQKIALKVVGDLGHSQDGAISGLHSVSQHHCGLEHGEGAERILGDCMHDDCIQLLVSLILLRVDRVRS